jgi:hypothetical protein
MGESKKTQTSQATPYSAAQPLIDAQAGAATNYLSDPNATAGARSAADYYGNVVNGDYLSAGNPYTSQLADSIWSEVAPRVNNNYAAAGLPNSTLAQGTMAKEYARALAQPLFANYQNERGMQQQAAAALPGAEFAASDAGKAANTLPISSSMTPYASQTQTSQVKQPLWQQIAGGGLAAAGLLSTPWGTAGQTLGGAANSAMGNPMGTNQALHDFSANTYVNGVRAPWQQYY